MKKLMMLFAALSLFMIACKDEIKTPPQEEKATLEIDAPASITFEADGTGGMEAITVTTNQEEWDYAVVAAEDEGYTEWLTVVKEDNQLKLTATPTDATVVPVPVKITFTAGDAAEKTTIVNLLTEDEEEVPTSWSVDDLWPSEQNPEGIVFWIDPASSTDGGITGTTGWVMSLKQAPQLAWSLNTYEIDMGTNSDTDGRVNWDAIWSFDAANPDYTGSFEIFEWCRTTYGEPWYIPSLQEMRRFVAVYTGLTPEQTETYMLGRRLSSLDTIFGSGTWYGTEEHRKAYDMRLMEIGADPLWDWEGSDDPQLWTSTKYDVGMPAIEMKPWYTGFLGEWGSSTTQAQYDTHLTRAMRRFGDETTVDVLSVNPTSITFGADDTDVKNVVVAKTASTFNASVSAPWVHITHAADSFTVSVDEYTEETAAQDNFVDRVAWISVVSGNAPVVTVTVTQVAPIAAALDLSGTWNWTGDIWDQSRTFTPMSGTAEAVYNEALGSYIFSYFLENLGMTDLLDPADRVDGSIALKVNEYNKIEFVTGAEMDRIFTGWWGTREYYNYATFFADDNSNLMLSGLEEGTTIEIAINGAGDTITFPATGDYEGMACTYGFGFGYKDLDPDSLEPAPSATMQPGGIYFNIILTRAE
jgi:hypothetical protein